MRDAKGCADQRKRHRKAGGYFPTHCHAPQTVKNYHDVARGGRDWAWLRKLLAAVALVPRLPQIAVGTSSLSTPARSSQKPWFSRIFDVLIAVQSDFGRSGG
jgi:hypothetical protein